MLSLAYVTRAHTDTHTCRRHSVLSAIIPTSPWVSGTSVSSATEFPSKYCGGGFMRCKRRQVASRWYSPWHTAAVEFCSTLFAAASSASIQAHLNNDIGSHPEQSQQWRERARRWPHQHVQIMDADPTHDKTELTAPQRATASRSTLRKPSMVGDLSPVQYLCKVVHSMQHHMVGPG